MHSLYQSRNLKGVYMPELMRIWLCSSAYTIFILFVGSVSWFLGASLEYTIFFSTVAVLVVDIFMIRGWVILSFFFVGVFICLVRDGYLPEVWLLGLPFVANLTTSLVVSTMLAIDDLSNEQNFFKNLLITTQPIGVVFGAFFVLLETLQNQRRHAT